MKTVEISIPIGDSSINGNLHVVDNANALVIFAHGSGSSRFSKRNQFVANILNQATISTLLFDLLTKEEDAVDQVTRQFRFDIPLLAERLVTVTKWVQSNNNTQYLTLGFFGSSTGAAAALIAAAQLSEAIHAVVSRGGRPDLAGDYLAKVKSPTLLIVGQLDYEVISLNESAYKQLTCTKEIAIIPGATHLFEEPGTLEQVATIASNWFIKFLV